MRLQWYFAMKRKHCIPYAKHISVIIYNKNVELS